MKKALLITGGSLILLLLLGVWLYLLFFGAPESVEDTFANFSFGGDAPVEPAPPTTTEPTSEPKPTPAEPEPEPLRQISDDPVAGWQTVVGTTSSTTTEMTVLYVAAGTGHIFRHDANSGEATRISNTTIPQTRTAHIAPDGSFAVTVAPDGVRWFDLSNPGTSTEPVLLDIEPHNLAVTDDNRVVYTEPTTTGARGVALTPSSGGTQTLFTSPFTAITVSWGQSSTDPHIVYNQPADTLPSYAYEATANSFTRLPISGYGLNLFHDDTTIWYSAASDPNQPERRASYWFDRETNTDSQLATTVLHEKCARAQDVAPDAAIWCASPANTSYSLGEWYRGAVRSNDRLWQINANGASTYARNLNEATGAEVDVDNLETPAVDVLLFRNKNDQTLWLYETN